jgi:hypothetical protein
MVLGMTRDELFDAFSRFVSAKAKSANAATPAEASADAVADDVHDEDPNDAVVADRAQPARASAKAKPPKKRR